MNFTKNQCVFSLLTFELAGDERERRLQCWRERERAHHDSETAEQREERLRKPQMRDRARRTAQELRMHNCSLGIVLAQGRPTMPCIHLVI